MSAIRVISAGVLGALCWGEFATWRASRQELPSGIGAPDGIRTVVVLGYPSAMDGSTTWVQRYRVRITLRCYRPDDTVVFCGAATRGSSRSEAAVMADYGVSRGLPADSVVLDEHSYSTWQNIENALPLINNGPIIIASNTFHARRARRYIWQQAPATADRLRRGCDYRFGELLWLKPVLAVARM